MTKSFNFSTVIITAVSALAVLSTADTRIYQGLDSGLEGLTIADDNAKPPHIQRRFNRRDGAPVEITSTDGKYSLGALCDQDTKINKYFLFGTDFQGHVQNICDAAFAWQDGQGSQAELMPVGQPAFSSQVDIKARRKIGETIWHMGKQRIVTSVTNLGMPSTTAAKGEARSLCADAVNYIGNTCLDGIGGTGDNGLHPKFQWSAMRDGSVVWSDGITKKPMLQITFTEENA